MRKGAWVDETNAITCTIRVVVKVDSAPIGLLCLKDVAPGLLWIDVAVVRVDQVPEDPKSKNGHTIWLEYLRRCIIRRGSQQRPPVEFYAIGKVESPNAIL